MIYLLLPHNTDGAIRMFGNYGLMEQVVRSQAKDWCVVYGYEMGIDEYEVVWVWRLGPNGILIRSPVKSSRPTQ